MRNREDILAYIEQIKAEDETAKTYGDGWRIRDWKTRRSMKAGEFCATMEMLTRAEAKARRRPGSIGARKAKQKAKAYRRTLKRLKTVMAEKYNDYRVTTPQYITTPWTVYYPIPNCERGYRVKDSGNASCHVE